MAYHDGEPVKEPAGGWWCCCSDEWDWDADPEEDHSEEHQEEEQQLRDDGVQSLAFVLVDTYVHEQIK